MSHSGGGAQPAHKLLGTRGIKLRVAAGSLIVLGVGAWSRPPAVPDTLSASQERAAPLLEEQVQSRVIVRPFQGVQETAARVRPFGVAIPYPERTRVTTVNDFSAAGRREAEVGFGVLVTDMHVLTHANVVRGREVVPVATVEANHDMRVVAYEPETGLVLLQSVSAIGSPPPMAAVPAAGALAVAAASWQRRDIAIPLFVTAVARDRYSVSAAVPRAFETLPLYTPDGALLAILAGEGAQRQAFPAGLVVEDLLARAARGERVASFGVSFQELTPSLQEAFGDGGVLVSDVVAGGPADLAGMQSGDVLLRVGEIDVASVDDAVRAVNGTTVGTATVLQVRRAGRARDVEVVPGLAYQVSWLAHGDRSSQSGVEARTAFSTESLDASGIPPGARVLSVNGQSVSSGAEIDRALRRNGSPARALIRDGDRQFFVALAPRR